MYGESTETWNSKDGQQETSMTSGAKERDKGLGIQRRGRLLAWGENDVWKRKVALLCK